jgi:hypothetical protein
MDVFVELPQRAEHVDVVHADAVRALERLDGRPRVSELDALKLGEALELAELGVVVGRGVDQAFAQERDAAIVLLVARELDERKQRGLVAGHERERLLVVRLRFAGLALRAFSLGDAGVDARALELVLLGADHEGSLVDVDGLVECATTSRGVARADQLVELVEVIAFAHFGRAGRAYHCQTKRTTNGA